MRRKRMHMTKMNRIYTFDIQFCLRPFQVERKFTAIDWCFQPDEVFKCNVQIPEEIRPHFCSLAILSTGLCYRWRNMLDHCEPSLNWFLSEMRWHETCHFYFENVKKTSTRLKLQGERARAVTFWSKDKRGTTEPSTVAAKNHCKSLEFTWYNCLNLIKTVASPNSKGNLEIILQRLPFRCDLGP